MLELQHYTQKSSNDSSEHNSVAFQCYEVTEGWKNNC